jgi:hypothetical protein
MCPVKRASAREVPYTHGIIERMSERLASFVDARVPGEYWVDMVYAGGEWQPAEHVPMPYHHATRLELVNEAAFPELARRRGERVRMTIELLSRDIHPVPGRHAWRTTYTARIVAVSADPGR